jgi:predicted transcriptional regulator YheO
MSTSKLAPYVSLVAFLGTVLPDYYEVSLTDLSSTKQCIVAIEHGHVSQREKGAPCTNMILQFIRHKIWLKKSYVTDYAGSSESGEELISSSFFITSEKDLIGVLTITVNASQESQLLDNLEKIKDLSDQIQQMFHPTEPKPVDSASSSPIVENFPPSLRESIIQSVKACFPGKSIDPTRFTQEERMQIVYYLYDREFFVIKKAVSELADYLACSEATIYRYVSIVRKDRMVHPAYDGLLVSQKK